MGVSLRHRWSALTDTFWMSVADGPNLDSFKEGKREQKRCHQAVIMMFTGVWEEILMPLAASDLYDTLADTY